MSAPAEAPNPGSVEARALGCNCPITDNNRGRGAYLDVDGRPLFWYTDGCPVHCPAPAVSLLCLGGTE